VGTLDDVLGWLTTGDHWQGEEGIPRLVMQHLQVSAWAMVVGAAVALPVGIGLGHLRRGGLVAINVSNVGRAVPSFALLLLAVQIWGIGEAPGPLSVVGSLPTFVALTALAIPPMLTNAYVGMSGVDDEVREAARGMGMNGRQLLWRIEMPMSVPLIMAGVRTAAVGVVATATLAAIVGFGGLGRLVWDGIKQQDDPKLLSGAILVALLAIVVEFALGLAQRGLVSRGLRPRGDRIEREIEAELERGIPASAPTVTPPS